ncbi:hypothetical protein ACP3VW_18815 [Vibrio sp. DNB22_17_1]
MEKIDFIIGESSWDVECFYMIFGYRPKCFIHNDFFSSSNVRNTTLINRFLSFISIMCLTLGCLFLCKRVAFTSLNLEVTFIANIFSKNKRFSIFIPNFIASPKTGSRLENVFVKYSGRILVSDVLTCINLQRYKPVVPGNAFSLRQPKKTEVSDMHFIVSLPAAYSHKETQDTADTLYSETLNIGESLKNSGFDIYYLPHPRDENIVLPSECKTILPEDISNLGDKVCYVSLVSSLSLNRRYGGLYGIWIRSDSLNISNENLYLRHSIPLKDFLDERFK